MSLITTMRAAINCDALGCRDLYEGSLGCDYAVEVRFEARADGWRVNVPRSMGPRDVNPLPFIGARLDFCPRHRDKVTPFRTPGFDGPEGTEWESRPWSEE